ncbi:nickel-dependent hydrogenase large subunit [Erythrobacter sp. SCSIO 43205]|uniref:nickel-dependent hydrogenase large subunit n=1 Tax=Erythrobacter sp. SCSIO 43205 TaxID=2779361 RepID=UPI001CA8B21A|nr:nickel-dependent hydrogenase large subunit [Erythrobacter sp. SCSIO 43205]UAB77835.1 nickel-dependent hydrogenase large subunit [Erythrobacter sp. SCSIO 43205]
MTKRIVMGPFNRVEGDLEVRLDSSEGQVISAEVTSPLYRGFEKMLVGKPMMDALVYSPRICGICSVSQSVAAAYALAGLGGRSVPPAGRHAVNLVHAVENLADHFTHFYLFFMPDFARDTYADEPWYQPVAERFAAVKGTAAKDALPARAAWMEMLGILAGKWPHTLSIQPGGSTRAISRSEKVRLGAIIAQFRLYLERTLFGDTLENVAGLFSADALWQWADQRASATSDFAMFLQVSRKLGLSKLGVSHNLHMSFGAYCLQEGHFLKRGAWQNGGPAVLALDRIREDISHAWYRSAGDASGPLNDFPVPDYDTSGDAYSWCKAPRLDGAPVEVGALSRLLVDGHPLLRELAANGANVEARIVARMLELALIVPQMEQWLAAIDTEERFIDHSPLAEDGEAAGLTEAARGSLGHWLRTRNGEIEHYQIIAPTTWNFSPRDAQGNPGPLEQALAGTPIREGEVEPVAVQHVVRSFDPCMVCTVH